MSAQQGVWSQVIGQEAGVAELRAAGSDPAAMTHAWLFTGPPGSGRSVAARAFAAALQCPDGGDGTCHACRTVLAGTHADVKVIVPDGLSIGVLEARELVRVAGRSVAARAFAAALQCPDGGDGTCHACRTVLSGTHADVNVIVPDGLSIGVNEARELVRVAGRSPSQGRWQMIIVEDADRMSESASNAVLKMIEEPPPRTVVMLCAPSLHPDDVPVTIRSRCRVVDRRPELRHHRGLTDHPRPDPFVRRDAHGCSWGVEPVWACGWRCTGVVGSAARPACCGSVCRGRPESRSVTRTRMAAASSSAPCVASRTR